MTIFDLLFAVLFLSGAGVLVAAAVAALRGRRAHALVLTGRVGIVAALYIGALLVVSAATPQHYLRVGDDQCSDDWCIAVQAVHRETIGSDTRFDVTLRLSSRARRVSQREQGVSVYLRGADGRRYAPVADAAAVPFDTLLAPGDAVPAERRFVVPRRSSIVGLVVARDGWARIPGCCIIGDEGSLFHRRTIVRLE